MLKNLLIGEIVSVHGVHGALKVKPLTDWPERFESTEEVDVKLPSSAGQFKKLSGRYKVSYASLNGNTVILMLDGVNDRNTAELFRGAQISVRRDEAVELPEDTYYIGDLIGSSVFELTDEAAGEAEAFGTYRTDAAGVSLLGKIFEVQPTGSNDIYGVKTPDGQVLYLPSIAQVVRRVDVENGLVFVKLLPGLKEVYLS